MYEETNGLELPICRTSGCPIKDLATDPAVNRFIERYRLARSLYELSEIPSLFERELKDLGLFDDGAFLLELEFIYRTARQAAQKQQHDREKIVRWKG